MIKPPLSNITVPIIENCARCGGTHENIVFMGLAQPITVGAKLYAHWAPCPTNGEPIINRISDTNFTDGLNGALATDFFDNGIRICNIVWLAGCVSDAEDVPDQLHEFLEESDHVQALFGFDSEALPTVGMVFEHIRQMNKYGFLVMVETPVPYSFSEKGTSWHAGWGYTQTKWFYTEALDPEFLGKVVEWKQRYHAAQYEKEFKKPLPEDKALVTSGAGEEALPHECAACSAMIDATKELCDSCRDRRDNETSPH